MQNSLIFEKGNTIFVGNLDARVTIDDLYHVLAPIIDRISSICEMKIVQNFKSSYAFVKFEEKITSIMIKSLAVEGLFLYQRQLRFSLIASKLEASDRIKELEKEEISEQPFVLQAEDPNTACIHSLFDDIIVHIFSFLSNEDLFNCALVCKRFKSLVTTVCLNKLRMYKGGCFKRWAFRNKNENGNLFLFAKSMLRHAGHMLKNMEICEELSDVRCTIFLITEYCPNLEQLSISVNSSILTSYINRLGDKCLKIKKLVLNSSNIFNDNIFQSILTKFKLLEILEVYSDVQVTRRSFRVTPKLLKEFSLFGVVADGVGNRMSHWKKLFFASRKLEVLNINGRITAAILMDATRYCPHIKQLSVMFGRREAAQSYKFLFPELQKLSITAAAGRIELTTLTENKYLTDLSIQTAIGNETDLIGDFTPLKGLRRLKVMMFPVIEQSVILSIIACTELEFLELNTMISDLSTVIICIKNLPKLNELVLSETAIREEHISFLVDAHSRNPLNLKLTIGMDESAFNSIERLHEANYEVRLIDVHNLFANDWGGQH